MTLTARDIMTVSPVTVTPDTPIREASKLMLDKRFNGLPVINAAGALVGIICQSDLVTQQKTFRVPSFFFLLDGFIPLESPKRLEDDLKRMVAASVGDLMTPNPYAIAPETPLHEVAALMVDKKYHTLPVVENGKLVGVIGKEDMLRTLVG